MVKNNSLASRLLIAVIRVYQYAIGPLLGQRCRFHPTCSSYALSALKNHPFFYGCFLVFKRLLRCHPWTTGGFDPVPKSRENS